jgi:hypothetical protein
MLREQTITLLQSAIVFLILTNLASAAAAIYALRSAGRPASVDGKSAVERNLELILRRTR